MLSQRWFRQWIGAIMAKMSLTLYNMNIPVTLLNSMRPSDPYMCQYIGSDNGLSPGQRQAIIWTNAGILLIGPLGTNFSEIFMEIYTFSVKKMHWKMAAILSL